MGAGVVVEVEASDEGVVSILVAEFATISAENVRVTTRILPDKDCRAFA